MPGGVAGGAPSLSSLVHQKEQEWRQMQAELLGRLEADVADKAAALAERERLFAELTTDFKYNLQLLADRDAELAQLEAALQEATASMSAKDEETVQLRTALDELGTAAEAELARHEAVESHFDARITTVQDVARASTLALQEEHAAAQQELLEANHKLELKISELDQKLQEAQRHTGVEIAKAVDAQRAATRHEVNQMELAKVGFEAKLTQKDREVTALQSKLGVLEELRGQLEQGVLDAQRKQQHAEWRLADLQAADNSRVTDAEWKLKQSEADRESLATHYEHKVVGLRVKLEAQAEAHLQEEGRRRDKEDQFIAELRNIQARVREQEREHEGALGALQDSVSGLEAQLRTKDVVIRRHAEELQAALAEKDAEKAGVIRGLGHDLDAAKAEAETLLSDNQGLRDRLLAVIEKENELRDEFARQKAALEATMARKVEREVRPLERGLLNERELLQAQIAQRDHTIAQQTEALSQLRLECGEAQDIVAAYRGTGLESNVGPTQTVQLENKRLRGIIKEMRLEMEALSRHRSNSAGEGHGAGAGRRQHAPDQESTVEVLRSEIRAHVNKIRHDEEVMRTNAARLGAMDRETKQQRSTIDHLRSRLAEQQSKGERQTAALKTKVAHLDQSLATATQEAQIYFKHCVEDTKHFSSLSSVLAALQHTIPHGTEPLQPGEFHRQAEILRHLQDKVALLYARASERNARRPSPAVVAVPTEREQRAAAVVAKLRSKLQLARGHIRRLASEKERLLDISNRLRVELEQAKAAGTVRLYPAEPPVGEPAHRNTPEAAEQSSLGAAEPRGRPLSVLSSYQSQDLGEVWQLLDTDADASLDLAVTGSSPPVADRQPAQPQSSRTTAGQREAQAKLQGPGRAAGGPRDYNTLKHQRPGGLL